MTKDAVHLFIFGTCELFSADETYAQMFLSVCLEANVHGKNKYAHSGWRKFHTFFRTMSLCYGRNVWALMRMGILPEMFPDDWHSFVAFRHFKSESRSIGTFVLCWAVTHALSSKLIMNNEQPFECDMQMTIFKLMPSSGTGILESEGGQTAAKAPLCALCTVGGKMF